ncbi:MAG: S8 family serine peptidase [Aureispira sp.]
MHKFLSHFVITLLCCSSLLHAQDYTVNFLKGERELEANVTSFSPVGNINPQEIYQNRFYRFLQFKTIPTLEQQTQIKAAGIRLLEYIPNKVYVASIAQNIDFSALERFGVRSIVPIEQTYKMGTRLEQKDYPNWAMEGPYLTVTVQYYKDINPNIAVADFEKMGLAVGTRMDHAHLLELSLLPQQVAALMAAPFVRYVDIAPEPGKPESDDGRHLHRANAIDGDYAGARNYDGTGVTFAINDDGFVGPHIDFKGRTNQQDVAGDFAGNHGDMVAGIAGGAGNLDPSVRGMATGSYLHIRQYRANMSGTLPLHQDSAVLIFSSSYSNGCNGGYTNTTLLVDQEIYNNPTLMQTFSAGNSNNQDCGYGAGNQWGNITGGHKIGKNVIATANLNANDDIVASSSRGPASDGRIKPDIAAHGRSQLSTDPNNGYSPGGGTSAAAPGICGVMAQLYHAYREINGTTAPSALLKATIMATANDLGNDGPDFIYGWGKINGLRAVKLLEDGRHFNDTIAQGVTNTHTITIPAGVSRAKIMVYWADVEASTSAATALVNNLDAVVTDPSMTTHLPWLLNSAPNATTLALPAIKGTDSLNNVEEIAIDNPAAGAFTLSITGTTVPMGAQAYYVVYEFITDEITVIHPMGGEGIAPNSSTRIHWDAYEETGSFLLEYTTDNGATWSTINANVPGNTRHFTWNTPATVSGQVRVRVSRQGVSDESDANFTLMERPQNLRVSRVCTNTNEIRVAWDAVPNATGYDVFLLGNKFMDSVGSTSALNYTFTVSNINDEQWFSVRATGANGLRSQRQIAAQYAGSTNGSPVCLLSCTGDNDAGVAAITSPQEIVTSCPGTTTLPVTFSLENKGLFTESNFNVSYQLDNDPVVTETYTGNLTAGTTTPFTFTTVLPFPTAGNHTLKIWTSLSSDSTKCNDTLIQPFNVLASIAGYPYIEDYESGAFPSNQSYVTNPDNATTWQSITTTGSAGTATTAMYIDNYNYNARGQEDIFGFTTLDLTQVAAGTAANLTFDVAYRVYSAQNTDGLRIELSSDCGQTFTPVYTKIGAALATGANVTQPWSPAVAGDWRTDSIDLGSYVGGSVQVRFVNLCDYGNNLYIDNINVAVDALLMPIADFGADKTYTCDGRVEFTDNSGNQPTQWVWDFGDGGTSTQANPVYQYNSSGTYAVSLRVNNGLGADSIVKTAYVEVELPQVAATNNGMACPNTPMQLSAIGASGQMYWYDSTGNVVHVGTNFTTPGLVNTTNYDVQNVILSPELTAGPANGTAVGGGGYHGAGGTFNGVINFNAQTNFTLISALVDAGSVGPRTFNLWSGTPAGGNIVQQVTVNIPTTGLQRISLNVEIPGPGSYSIGGSGMDLFRNNSGTSYPYTLPGVLTMTGSSAGASFYYYLYDWKVRTDSCASPSSPVVAEVVEANFSAVGNGATAVFTDSSVGVVSWLWDFGDGNSSTQQNPTHTYTSNGPHLVTLTINNGACSYTDSVEVITSLQRLQNGLEVVLMPNPTKDYAQLRFSKVLEVDVEVTILGVNGQVVRQQVVRAGEDRLILQVADLPAAVYLVRLTTAKAAEVHKLIIRE